MHYYVFEFNNNWRQKMKTQESPKVTFEVTPTTKTKYNLDIIINNNVVLTAKNKNLDVIEHVIKDTIESLND